jgi:NitT/TauT family transport system permease protein
LAQRLLDGIAEAQTGPSKAAFSWRWTGERLLPALGYLVPTVIALTLAGVAWELWVRIGDKPVYILPAPSVVFERLSGDLSFFAREGATTLYEALAGFAIGSTVAILLGVAMAHSRFIEKSIFPLAILVKVTPIVAIAPLLVIWFGFGAWPKVLIAALLVFFPVMVNSVVGFRSVNPGALDFAHSLRASPLEIFWLLRLPSSLPYIFAAFRIVIPLAVIGAVIAEWFSAEAGLGSVIAVAHSDLDMPTLFSAVATLAVIGIGLTMLTWVIERRLLFWHESTLA